MDLRHTWKCGWIDSNGGVCGEEITSDCARHLAAAHGITKMPAKHLVWCGWCSPPHFMKRESVLRHVREVHMGLPRSRRGGT
ncbi:hypothetical protein ID866_8293 [Astraeus odoratus]|nr:hypothetical protein ID866_8293 [Astraeus odoratus]